MRRRFSKKVRSKATGGASDLAWCRISNERFRSISRRLSIGCLALGVAFSIDSAHAEIAVSRLAVDYPATYEHLRRLSDAPLLVRRAVEPETLEQGWPVNGVFTLSESFALQRDISRPRPGAVWSPKKKLLLDQARATIRSSQHRQWATERGMVGTGAGVAIGIIDSGVDVTHADLRDTDGATRVAWMLVFGVRPFGFFPELEERFGCTQLLTSCGVLSSAELDELLAGSLTTPSGRQVPLPEDLLGHGTHVASLAVGNGNADANYVGVAPEASLIVAQVAQTSTSVTDADVLRATQFVFDRADELEMPAVVNLSLGGDFGPHDGRSEIGEALVDLIETDRSSGRAIVVAAGNSGGLLTPENSPYPGPHGIRTDVHVPVGASARVPVLLPAASRDVSGSVFVWIAFRPGQALRVGVESREGTTLIRPLSLGGAQTVNNGRHTISALVGLDEDLGLGASSEHSAAVVLDGTFDPGEVFALRLEGQGSATMWLQTEGFFDAQAGAPGALFPRASRSQTINIPADSPELIAVGALLNRDVWPARSGGTSELSLFDNDLDPELGTLAFFSSAGPTTTGVLKPDLVAPGAAVLGAMSAASDPADSGPSSIFLFSPLCDGLGCSVASDSYAVTSGTSMAAPIVAGAAALLFEQDPSLTHLEVQALLQAGAQRLEPTSEIAGEPPSATQLGAGVLDIEASARVLWMSEQELTTGEPSARTSRVSLSDDLARPDESWELSGLVHLRDDDNLPTTVESERMSLAVEHGRVVAPLSERAPGLYGFSVAAGNDSGGRLFRVSVTLDGQVLASAERPVSVDTGSAAGGLSLRGACALSSPRDSGLRPVSDGGIGLGLGLVWLLLRRRK